MNYELWFPTPIWWEDTTDIDIPPILNLCYRLKAQEPKGRKLSNQGGWQSKDFEANTYSELKSLEQKILVQAENCIRDYGYDENDCNIGIGNIWININGQYNANSVHIHDSSFISGVFYVKARPGQGAINLYKSYSQDYIVASQATIKNYTQISASACSYQPYTGRLIMFPGYLPHGVEHNELDEDRISISFNVKLLRTIDGLYWTKNIKRN